ncbi:MAG: Outer rane efflux protein [Verrucomicrobiales bacterium]|nr:Outer rane efflux protein [Verrucomicrobiales bacterium]
MKRLYSLVALMAIVGSCLDSQAADSAESTNHVYPIDLATTMKLAGARNLDVQIARQRLAEARATREAAVWSFLPTVSPGLSYRRHDNLIQTVEGRMIETEKESYTVGPTVTAQVDLGEAIFRELAAHQLLKAADYALESQRQESLAVAAQNYFDLVRASAAIEVAREAVRISTNYAAQVERATGAGIAFKGDQLRVQVQTEKNRQVLRRAQEQERVAAARLAQVLHLERAVELRSRPDELVPLQLVDAQAALATLVQQALNSRPEVKESRSRIAAAKDARSGAVYGPLIPSAGAQVYAGGLGGSMNGTSGTFGESEDYLVTLGWKIGPGGLFDRSRVRLAESRLNIARLSGEKLDDEITRQVIEAQTHFQSSADQLEIVRRAAQAAEESLRLTGSRKEFGVGAVLENILAEEELTRSRLELLNVVAEYNKAQFAVQRALGQMGKE